MQLTREFGIGNWFINPTSGLLAPNPTPLQLNTLQDLNVEFSGKGVELRGQLLYAVDARLADISVKGKFKLGQWSLDQFNQMYFAGTLATGNSGEDNIFPDVPEVVPPSSVSHILTITGVVEDLGVSYASNGSNFDRVTTAPTQGQYEFAVVGGNGQWTFSAADTGTAILVSYVGQGAAATLQIPNNLQGQSPNLELVGWNPVGGQAPSTAFNGIRLYNVVVTGVKPKELKRDGFNLTEVDFMAFCPTGSSVAELIQTQF